MNFNDLVEKQSILKAIEKIGYETPTEIQQKAVPLIKGGADVIGKSQTGTGKTMAFAIPLVECIDTNEDKRSIQALILCPTRELAMQVADEIKKLTQFTDGIKSTTIYGGSSMQQQVLALKKANVVIGTPGRVIDHIKRKTLKLQNLKMIVLDEADEMLSMGFRDDIAEILTKTPDTRQTILFSATMPKAIMDLTEEFQKNPVTIETAKKQATVSKIVQKYIEVPMGRKMDSLKILMHIYSNDLSIIFCNTKKMVDEIEQTLSKSGFKALGLHGDMKQEQRTKVMSAFKSGFANVLVATDVAARGIDVDDINYVINYDIPQNSEYYVHRIGRTGRANKNGTAITILSGKKQFFDLKDLQRDLKIKIDSMKLPDFNDIKSLNMEKNINAVVSSLETKADDTYYEMIDTLVEKGYDIKDICASVLNLHFAKLDNSLKGLNEIKHNSHQNNDDFTKIKLNIGRKQRIAPNHLVAAIADTCSISSKNIGKIEIFDAFSLVSILKDDYDNVLSSMQNIKINGVTAKASPDSKPQNRRFRRN